MAQRVIWSIEALDDVDALAEFISRDSPVHARRVVEEILAIGETLADQPKLGRMVPELGDDAVRERFLYSYRIIYEIRPRTIEVLAVIHGKRLIEAIEDRLP